MKYITLACMLCLSGLNVFAQFKPGDIGYNVNSEIIFKNANVTSQIVTVVESDDVSFVSSYNYYNKNGQLDSTIYPPDYYIGQDEQLVPMKDLYTYLPSGQISMITMQGYDLLDINYGFEYNKKGKLITSIIASAEAREYTYMYDDKGRISGRNGKGARFVYENEEDTEGKLVMIDVERSTYTWNPNGDLSEENFYYMNEWMQRTVYSYNEQHQLIRMDVYNDNSPDAIRSFYVTYQYDDRGLLIESATVESDYTAKTTYAYTFY